MTEIARSTSMEGGLTLSAQNQEIAPLVVHMIDTLNMGGAERLIADLLESRSSRFRYVVLCLGNGGVLAPQIEALGVPVVLLGLKPGPRLHSLYAVWNWLRKARPAVVHTHLYAADSFGRLAAWLCNTTAIVSTRHNSKEWPGRFRQKLARRMSLITDRIVACGPEVAEFAARTERLPQEKVLVVRNGINIKRLRNGDAAALRRELEIDGDTPLIGQIGRLHPQKGHLVMLAALDALRAQGLKFRCVFVGDGELREPIAAEIRRRNLGDVVQMLGQRNDIPDILAAIDVFAMPSLWEGLPLALLEAMAMRKAVIATTVGGVPGVITNDRDGVLVAPDNPEELARGLASLIGSGARRTALGEEAQRVVNEHYSASTTMRAYEALYDELLGRKSAGKAAP